MKNDVEVLLAEVSSPRDLRNQESIDLNKLNDELSGSEDPASGPYRQALGRELTRNTMLAERFQKLSSDLRKKAPTADARTVLTRLENFLARFYRLRIKQMAERHLPAERAKEVASAVDCQPDSRSLRKLLPRLRGLSEEAKVAGLIEVLLPAIARFDATLSIYHTNWNCALNYDTELDAKTAMSDLQSGDRQTRTAWNRLKSTPTVGNLLRFLGRALPADQLPRDISVKVQ